MTGGRKWAIDYKISLKCQKNHYMSGIGLFLTRNKINVEEVNYDPNVFIPFMGMPSVVDGLAIIIKEDNIKVSMVTN